MGGGGLLNVLSLLRLRIESREELRDEPFFIGGYHFWDLQTIFF